MKKIATVLLISLALTGCMTNTNPNSYNSGNVGQSSTVLRGVIVDIQQVSVSNSGVGGVAGTVAGAAAGSNIGGNTSMNIVGAVGGAVVGGLLGTAIDKGITHKYDNRYIVKTEQNNMIAVVQNTEPVLAKGQHVYIIGNADKTRLVADDSYQAAQQPAVSQKPTTSSKTKP